MPKMTVYVATSESGEYDDYRLKVRGVFASFENAQASFTTESPDDWYEDDEEDPAVWGEWEELTHTRQTTIAKIVP